MVKLNFKINSTAAKPATDRPRRTTSPNMPKVKRVLSYTKAPSRITKTRPQSKGRKADSKILESAQNLYEAAFAAWVRDSDSDSEESDSEAESTPPRPLHMTFRRYDEQNHAENQSTAAQRNSHSAASGMVVRTSNLRLNFKLPSTAQRPSNPKHQFRTHEQQKKILTKLLTKRTIYKPLLKFGTREQKEKSLERILHKRLVRTAVPSSLKINMVPSRLKINVREPVPTAPRSTIGEQLRQFRREHPQAPQSPVHRGPVKLKIRMPKVPTKVKINVREPTRLKINIPARVKLEHEESCS